MTLGLCMSETKARSRQRTKAQTTTSVHVEKQVLRKEEGACSS